MIDQRTTFRHFALFLSGRLSLAEFESWVYKTDGLEGVLGSDRYLRLISFPFKAEQATTQLADLLVQFARDLDAHEFIKQRAIIVLENMLNEKVTLPSGCLQLTHLRNGGGEQIIPIEFVGYESELDTVPEPENYHLWDAQALQRQLQRLDWYKNDILALVRGTLYNLSQPHEGAT